VGLRPGPVGCGNSRAHRDSIPGTSSPWWVAIPTELSQSTTTWQIASQFVFRKACDNLACEGAGISVAHKFCGKKTAHFAGWTLRFAPHSYRRPELQAPPGVPKISLLKTFTSSPEVTKRSLTTYVQTKLHLGRWSHSSGSGGRQNDTRCSIRGRRESSLSRKLAGSALTPVQWLKYVRRVRHVTPDLKSALWLIFAAMLFNDTASTTRN
jgi:hypothetical protein